MIRPKLSKFLLKILIWMLCTHSLSYASILSASSLASHIENSLGSSKKEFQNTDKSSKILEKLKEERNKSISFSESLIEKLSKFENNLGWSSIHVDKDTPAHGQLIENSIDLSGLKQEKNTLVSIETSQNLISKCIRYSANKVECAKYLTELSMSGTKLESVCNSLKTKCSNINSKYRLIDGSCQNANKPNQGKSFTGYRRLLFPNYLDGIYELKARNSNRNLLPSARLVSVKTTGHLDNKYKDLTLAFMQWSQFVLHDLAHTANRRMLHTHKSIVCCHKDGYNLAPRDTHPFCMPIDVDIEDAEYGKYRMECMNYVRSLPAFNDQCRFGPQSIMNQATHYLDGSQIYGSTPKKALKLREKKGGLLRTSTHDKSKPFLPHSQEPEEDCQVKSNKSECYQSGDIRVNHQPHLTTMHVLWHREHNRIATRLHEINNKWDDEKLYQEARRIVIAQMQHITYTEWLNILLGQQFANKINVNVYKASVDPSVSNSFASAAMKFTSTLIDSNLQLYDEDRQSKSSLRLHDHFYKPEAIRKDGTLDGLVRGLATQKCQQLDMDIVTDVREKLYITKEIGLDALSLDIQRGRDHGLPHYLDYRKFCQLPHGSKFSDLSDHIDRKTIKMLESVYEFPQDIDLVIGGLAEKPYLDSMLGPTFTCLIAEQFYRTRWGDKYFYTNENKTWSFSPCQLEQIKRVTLATIFCNNGDDIKMMQPHVFNTISSSNELVNCSELKQMDLNAWKE